MDKTRITPERARAAYEATGLKPARGAYQCAEANTACPIGACMIAIGKPHSDIHVAAIRRLGVNYLRGFLWGFEGKHDEFGSERGQQGFEDGRACAAAVLPTAKDSSLART